MKTRAFKSGNSQAVRIPAEMAYADESQELEITRSGDVLIVRPAGQADKMREAIEILRGLPKPEKIGHIERTQTRTSRWDEDE
jgi:antitoxin VapB